MTSTTRKDTNGNIEWRNEQGDLHRENGPAVECTNGYVEYCLNNKKGPKIERKVKENIARLQAQKE